MKAPANEKGFTLIEAMVAMVVLAIGILGVVVMQTRAVNSNASAYSRTGATGVGISVMETLQSLPSADASLIQTHAVAGLLPNTVTAAMADPNVRRMNAATLATMPTLNNVYRIVGTVADPLVTPIVGAGGAASARAISYRIGWAVVDNAATNSKTIRVYQGWTTPMGSGTSQVTTIKYNK